MKSLGVGHPLNKVLSNAMVQEAQNDEQTVTLSKAFLNKLLKLNGTIEPSSAIKPEANVEDAKNLLANKHLKPPKGGWNVFIALKKIITHSQEKASKKGVGIRLLKVFYTLLKFRISYLLSFLILF
jgi:hypothetical protein